LMWKGQLFDSPYLQAILFQLLFDFTTLYSNRASIDHERTHILKSSKVSKTLSIEIACDAITELTELVESMELTKLMESMDLTKLMESIGL